MTHHGSAGPEPGHIEPNNIIDLSCHVTASSEPNERCPVFEVGVVALQKIPAEQKIPADKDISKNKIPSKKSPRCHLLTILVEWSNLTLMS